MRQFAASTHPGHRRNNNEDCFEAAPELGLWLVADGVGGHASGEVASAIVGSTMRDDIAQGKKLIDAIHHCHQSILAEIRARDTSSDMGSTVVALRLRGNHYEIAWVGDSRAYLWDGKLRQLTHDHNPVYELQARGAISAEEAAVHPDRHVLTQSLGVSERMLPQPGSVRGELLPGQQILLCSDGLTDELPDPAIARHLGEQPGPQQQVDVLVEAALAAGGRDNVTVLVVGEPENRHPSSPASPASDMRTTVEFRREQDSANPQLMLWPLLGALALLGLWYWLA